MGSTDDPSVLARQSTREPRYALGYDSPAEGEDVGHWTIRVRGGGAFLANAALTLKSCAMERNPGPMRDCLERLYEACDEALGAEDRKVGIDDV